MARGPLTAAGTNILVGRWITICIAASALMQITRQEFPLAPLVLFPDEASSISLNLIRAHQSIGADLRVPHLTVVELGENVGGHRFR